MENYYIASDHAGWELKELIKQQFSQNSWIDFGTTGSSDSVDYPDFANEVCQAIYQNPKSKGILVCGSGQGMAMRANKFPWIRAALVWNPESTKLSRIHNNSNVLCLGGRLIDHMTALDCVRIFLTTPFEGGRHQNRVDKLSEKIELNPDTVFSSPRSLK
jgi:ribose 5-phosphate isomerase B